MDLGLRGGFGEGSSGGSALELIIADFHPRRVTGFQDSDPVKVKVMVRKIFHTRMATIHQTSDSFRVVRIFCPPGRSFTRLEPPRGSGDSDWDN